jgi:hypothetical protein
VKDLAKETGRKGGTIKVPKSVDQMDWMKRLKKR